MQKFIDIVKRIFPDSLKRIIKEWLRTVSEVDRVQDLEAELKQLESILLLEKDTSIPPPKHLQVRTVGVYVPNFIKSGYFNYEDLNNALKLADKKFSNFHKILDFGCGCGRIIRAVKKMNPTADLYGAEIDQEAIEWLKENYKNIARFSAIPHNPPTKYENNEFDFIYAVSVFTHLPEKMQFSWLEELKRISKPDAYLLLTVHGKKHFSNLPEEYKNKIQSDGFCYMDNAALTDGLPAFYKVAYHSEEYIQRVWSKYFKVVRIVPLGIGGHQDIVILQKSSSC